MGRQKKKKKPDTTRHYFMPTRTAEMKSTANSRQETGCVSKSPVFVPQHQTPKQFKNKPTKKPEEPND